MILKDNIFLLIRFINYNGLKYKIIQIYNLINQC